MKYYFSLCLLLFSMQANSQAAVDSVKAVINTLFAAMKASDAMALTQTFADSAILQTIATGKDGKVTVRNEAVGEFARQIGSIAKGDADERITYEIVRVDADLAIAWTPYQFFFKGKFSHCGVNSFQLVRLGGLWKIQYLIDTRRRDQCL